MAVSITIGGVTLRLVSFQERPREYRGEAARAFDNTLLDGRDAPKRSWSGETDWVTTAEEATLRAAVEAGPVSCSGLVLPGGAVTCSVDVDGSVLGPGVQGGLTDYALVNSRLSLTLREV